MKKLLASTALIFAAGAAAAETGVTISGMGRFGLVYYSGNVAPTSDTRVDARLRFNIDATTETDSGVVFGGRIRMQWDDGATNAGLSAARLNVSYEGLRVEVGNANTAFDSAALLYNSEVGYVSSSAGNSRSSFYSFSTGALPLPDYMAIFASYSMNGFTGQVSYATPDQSGATVVNEETSIALSYETDMFAVSGAYVTDGAGIADNDVWFLGGAYKGLANTTIGLNYIEEGEDGVTPGVKLGTTIVAYAHYTMDAWTFKGYISNNDYVGNTTDTGFGIGADYDLGGATLAGGIQRDYAEETYVDFGVRFDF
ncbi:MAG: porin [Proteobacteria bacterium]|nr:porin [Pseudomonadota bacterium]